MDLYIGRIVGFIIGFFFFGGPITGIIGAGIGYIFVDKDKIILDPGIGFGKTYEMNLEMLKNLQDMLEEN